MPTIDELPAATASADTDEFMCSQGGIARKATRAQLLASAQPLIALTGGQLLGRSDPGAGGVEPIALGANLSFANGVLSGTAPFAISSLPAASVPAPGDLVVLSQAGQNVAATYAEFLAGLPGVPSVNAGAMVAQATGGTAIRAVADHFANTVAAEDFGAVGDGVSDDTAALNAALASGLPVRLGARSYCTSGQWTITGAEAVLLGVPGQTVLRRLQQSSGGAWISVQSARFRADGVMFDANSTIVTDASGVLVTPACLDADFHRCAFSNARGSSLGSGLTFQAADPAVTQHAVRACEASNNAVHGIWVQAVQTVRIDGCRAYGNGQYGFCVDYADPALVQKIRYCQIVHCAAWNNQRGISVGNYNATNTTPPVWGNANPDAIGILVSNNVCHDNSVYGIAVAGSGLLVTNNALTNNGVSAGAGLLANVAYTRIAGNMVSGGSYYGIDAGGSIVTDIAGNHVSGSVHGITPGGSANVRVIGNVIQDCTGWSVLVNNVETDGNGQNFGMACSGLSIVDNQIGFSIGGGGGGILLLDNPQTVLVARNSIVGSGAATVGQALWANTNAAVITGNSWNYAVSASAASSVGRQGGNALVYPDLLDALEVTSATSPITSLISQRQQALAGQIGFISLLNGGSGYTKATVAVSGDGKGASAIAYVSNGAVIGITLTNAGSGYSTVSVAISGDGTGATASGVIGLPVLPGRTLTLRCDMPVVFANAAGSAPAQDNWTGYNFTVPGQCEVRFTGHAGGWQAGVLSLADYVAPDGEGGAALVTQNGGDLVLKPGGGGHLRIANAAETIGVSTTIGRGSPAGVVSAPPGSDYRNLNGGAGSTYWIKQSGSGSSGWAAIA
jgi:hypothetical protein